MDCIEAQQYVSEALDQDAVDLSDLAAAKEHCRGCPDCATYVRALIAVRKSGVPTPPADLTERIMARIAAEQQVAEEHSLLSEIGIEPVVARVELRAEPEKSNLSDLLARVKDPRNRRAVVTWASAAAVVFIAAGYAAVLGTRQMLVPSNDQEIVLDSTYGQAGSTAGQQSAAPEAATAPQSDAAAGASKVAGPGGLIVVDGAVYRLAGEDTSVDPASLTNVGSTDSSLEQAGTPSRHAVLGSADPSRVFITSSGNTVLAFDRVTRSWGGRTYVLQSGSLPTFGSAISLPADVPVPTSADGSPDYVPADQAADTGVFVLRGKGASTGIALRPGVDPAYAGSWTWWAPVQ